MVCAACGGLYLYCVGRAGNCVPGPALCFVSADDKFGHPPHLFAPLQPDGYRTCAHVVHYHRAAFVDAIADFADADGADRGVAVKPGERRIAGPGNFPPNQCRPVLQCGKAAGVKSSCELMDRPDAGEDFHCRLYCAAGDRADFRQGVDRAQRCRTSVAERHRWRSCRLRVGWLVRLCCSGSSPVPNGM